MIKDISLFKIMKTITYLKMVNKLYHYSIWLISLIISLGAGIYYFYALNWLGLIISLILSLIVFRLLTKYRPLLDDSASNRSEKNPHKSTAYLLLIPYLISQIILYFYLLSARSGRPLISPWEVVNNNFFIIYGISTLLLIIILSKKYFTSIFRLILISTHYFLALIVTACVYKIGYGFDPFIHRAALELIDLQGFVLPKTPYYLGQYSLIITLHKISFLKIAWLNIFLVPVLAALYLPATIYRFLKQKTATQNIILNLSSILLVSSLLIKPFIITTPQNLSYLFLILSIFNSLDKKTRISAWLTALASAAIHPLTGLPALIWMTWISLRELNYFYQPENNQHQKYLKYGISFLLATILPFVLYLGGGAKFHLGNINDWLEEKYSTLIGSPGLFGAENIFLNLTYFLINNYQLVLMAGLLSVVIFYSRNKKNNQSLLQNLIIAASALFIAYFLSGWLQFTNVISYEQTNYSQRIPWLIFFFLLPILIIIINRLINLIFQESNTVKIICLFLVTGLMSAALYGAYPRFDKYYNSRGYSTSDYDFKAVRAIEADSKGAYVVLANQQVSAAALCEFGFNRYLRSKSEQIYFYPIPTGGPLYQYYLDMVYKKPDRENVAGAFALSGADTIYLVINRYWNNSRRLIAEAQITADNWWQIDKEIFIFKYRR